MDKIKITKQEFDENYEVEETIENNTIEKEIIKTEEPKQETVLNDEEQASDDKLAETLNWDKYFKELLETTE